MYKEELQNLMTRNHGILKTSDALSIGISKSQFYQFVKDAELNKVAHGIFASPNSLVDEMYLLQAQFPKAIFSHDAALYLHELSESEPVPLTVTVSANYNSSGLIKNGIKVFYIKKEWYELGLTQMLSFGGHIINVYDLERTICDILRRCDNMDIATFNYAVRSYVKRSDKDLARLSYYASILHLETKLRERMGVLF